MIPLPAKYLVQMAHLTAPATSWKYVESAVTKGGANLVMLDLEDSMARGDDNLLQIGRDNIVKAMLHLPWGNTLRFFRPRSVSEDPSLSDLLDIVPRVGQQLDGVMLPKVELAEELITVDRCLTDFETSLGLEKGSIKIEFLIESVVGEHNAFALANATKRLAGIVFGAFDYWSTLGLSPGLYRFDHPLLDTARINIVKAAASVGVPAIAEMTLNFPTRDKSPEKQKEALDDCRRDANHAKYLGFSGKWTGIPAQTAIVLDTFRLEQSDIDRAIKEVRAFADAESKGRGAVMIDGKMADRATDRMNRVLLLRAARIGQIAHELAAELGVLV